MKPQHDQELVDSALTVFQSGLYLMTSGFDGQRGGMLVHSVQRCGSDPALLCVAARKGHKIDPLIRDSRGFAVGVLGDGDRLIERRFSQRETAPHEQSVYDKDDPFDAIQTTTLTTGSPIIPRCSTWFDCEVLRRVDLEAEMELFVGLVVGVLHEGRRAKLDWALDSLS